MSDCLSVNFDGHSVRICCDRPYIYGLLREHLAGSLSEDMPNALSEFQIIGSTTGFFSVLEQGSRVARALPLEALLQFLMQEILTRLNAACDKGPLFHAASIADNEGGILLCGKSGSGKSTLAAFLLQNGYAYLSDEVTQYLPLSHQISGFRRSLVLKPGSSFLLAKHAPAGILRFSEGGAWVNARILTPAGLREHAIPRLVLFPRYCPDSSLVITPLSPPKALFHLLQTLVNARNLPQAGLPAVKQLAQQVPAFALTYSNLNEVLKWLKLS